MGVKWCHHRQGFMQAPYSGGTPKFGKYPMNFCPGLMQTYSMLKASQQCKANCWLDLGVQEVTETTKLYFHNISEEIKLAMQQKAFSFWGNPLTSQSALDPTSIFPQCLLLPPNLGCLDKSPHQRHIFTVFMTEHVLYVHKNRINNKLLTNKQSFNLNNTSQICV